MATQLRHRFGHLILLDFSDLSYRYLEKSIPYELSHTYIGSVLSLILEYLITRRKTLRNTVAAFYFVFVAKCKVLCVCLVCQDS